MPFSKKCGATIHKEHASNGNSVLSLNGKGVSLEDKQKLLYNKIISTRTTNICQQCIDLGISTCNPRETVNVARDEDEINVDKMKSVIIEIRADVKKLRSECKGFDALKNYDASTWINERPKKLLRILKCLCNITEVSTKQEIVKFALVIEAMYGCWSPNLVLPLSMLKNLLTHRITHSKQSVQLESKLLPAGTYQHISDWVQKESVFEKLVPNHDVKAMFDNGQVIGKTWALHPLSKMPSSIVTVHGQISLGICSKVQWVEQLKPRYWWFTNVELVEGGNDDIFKSFRDEFIKNRLQKLMDNVKNDVEEMSAMRKWFNEVKFCRSCGRENNKTFRVCRVCDGKLERQSFSLNDFETSAKSPSDGGILEEIISNETTECIFDNVEVIPKRPGKKFTIVCGEPNMLNPNSYENISEVLRSLGCRAGIKRYGNGSREWMFVEVDATIFVIVIELINKTYACDACRCSYFGKENFQTHGCQSDQNEFDMEFDWIVPIPGLLHIEMNACKAFVEWNWEVFIKHVAMELGFMSDNAQTFMKNCSDHHKTWRLCELLLYACTEELLYPYVEESKAESTVEGFWKWINVKNNEGKLTKNYVYLQEMVLSVLMAIVLFRISVRRNHYEGIKIAMEKISVLFYGRNHPIYQKVYANFVKLHMYMPEALRNLLKSAMATSISGYSDTCQGGDACLEEINKKLKFWLADTGVPTEEQWLKSMRLLEKMEMLRHNMNTQLGSNESSCTKRQQRISKEDITFVRSIFRMSCYFQRDIDVHTSIVEKEELDEELIFFPETVNMLKKDGLEKFVGRANSNDASSSTKDIEDSLPMKIQKIFVTKRERATAAKVSKMTIKELTEHIEKLLPLLDERFTDEYTEVVKGRKKHFYIDFYERLLLSAEQDII